MVKVDGVTVKVGDYVGFKSDIEQSGKIVKINPNGTLVLENPNGFEGAYIGGLEMTLVEASRCWLD
jgi:hypothetical protein